MDWITACGILEVPQDASEQQIKEQRNYWLNVLHPDKTMGLPDRIKAKADKDFIDKKKAWEYLLTPGNRPSPMASYRAQESPRAQSTAETQKSPSEPPSKPQEPPYERPAEPQAEPSPSPKTKPMSDVSSILYETKISFNWKECWERIWMPIMVCFFGIPIGWVPIVIISNNDRNSVWGWILLCVLMAGDLIYAYKGGMDKGTIISQRLRTAIAYYNLGRTCIRSSECSKAIHDFTMAIALEPNYAEAYEGRGTAYHFKCDYDKAIADFTRTIEIDPKYAEAYDGRGTAYCFKGDYDKAFADLTKATELAPKLNVAVLAHNLSMAYYKRGNDYYYKGEQVKAEADWRKAKEMGYK